MVESIYDKSVNGCISRNNRDSLYSVQFCNDSHYRWTSECWLLTLRQAIGVIMGANIGTTFTAFIIGIDMGIYFYPLLAVGAAFLFFFKRAIYQHVGQVLFGFGGLF